MDKRSKLRELEAGYRKDSLSKEEYIKKMHEEHRSLFDYSEFIKDKNIKSIIVSEDVILEVKNGIKLVWDPEDERATPVEIVNFGDYEAEEIRMLQTFLKEDSVVLDIGANVGWYSLILAGKVPKGKVLSFEPIPKIFDYLNKNIRINNLANIKTYNFGFSEKQDLLDFYYDPLLTASTSLRNLHENREKIRIRCEVRRMDDVIPKIAPRVDLIKCDVEGAEIFVIKGGLEVLNNTKPVLFLEMLRKWSAKFGYHPNDIIAILKGIGYRCYYAESGKLVQIDKVTEETIATNFFFIYPERDIKINS